MCVPCPNCISSGPNTSTLFVFKTSKSFAPTGTTSFEPIVAISVPLPPAYFIKLCCSPCKFESNGLQSNIFNTLSPSKSPNIGKPFCCFNLVIAAFSGFPKVPNICFTLKLFGKTFDLAIFTLIPKELLILFIALFFAFLLLFFIFDKPIPNPSLIFVFKFNPANALLPNPVLISNGLDFVLPESIFDILSDAFMLPNPNTSLDFLEELPKILLISNDLDFVYPVNIFITLSGCS